MREGELSMLKNILQNKMNTPQKMLVSEDIPD